MRSEWFYRLDFVDPVNGRSKGGEFSGGATKRECVRRLVRSLRYHRGCGVAEGRFIVNGEMGEVCESCHGEGTVPRYKKKGFSVLRKPCQSCKKVKHWYRRSFTLSPSGITTTLSGAPCPK